MFHGIKTSDINKIRKKYSLSKKDSLTASQFRELQVMSSTSSVVSPSSIFSFAYTVDFQNHNSIIEITIYGNHISKNVYDGLPDWGKKSKYRYRDSIKQGAKECFLVQREDFHKNKKKGFIPIRKGSISYTFYSTDSRDWDNNFESIKRFQDTLVALKIIADDSRNIIVPDSNSIREVIIKNKKDRKCVIKITNNPLI